MVNILVGGVVVEEFTGEQLAPATSNPCVGAACGTVICAGEDETMTYTVTNLSGAPLAATATIRVQGKLALDGDPDFADCWLAAMQAEGLPCVDAAALLGALGEGAVEEVEPVAVKEGCGCQVG